MCILKYLNRKLSIIKYEIPSENFRYKEKKWHRKLLELDYEKLVKDRIQIELRSLQSLLGFFTLDRRFFTMKLSSIKP